MVRRMATATFRFYEELNDFLPAERRKIRFAHDFDRSASVKDMIESLGVPHTEVDLILVNGASTDFSHRVSHADDISVYPLFESLDIQPLQHLRPEPLRTPRFVVDSNLGRLARYLRLLGFDSDYDNGFSDRQVAQISHDQHRIALTRDRRLLHRKIITHGYFVRSVDPGQQLKEVVRRMDLSRLIRPFTRCSRCNGLVQPVNKADIETRLQPKTRRYYQEFHQCRGCQQIYWRGSHYAGVLRLVASLGNE